MSTPLNSNQWAQRANVGKEQEIDLGQVNYSQFNVDPIKVDRFAAAMKAGQTMAPPIGSYKDGVFTTQDGHHRIAAALKLGKSKLKVKVF